jgi:predicted GH43/DUF377 family glycosyl hydrolase
MTPAKCLYHPGLALFDRETPQRCIRRSNRWVFGPEASSERFGEVSNVVFLCGYTIGSEQDTVNLYYGAAESSICLTKGSIRRMLDWLEEHAQDITLGLD